MDREQLMNRHFHNSEPFCKKLITLTLFGIESLQTHYDVVLVVSLKQMSLRLWWLAGDLHVIQITIMYNLTTSNRRCMTC